MCAVVQFMLLCKVNLGSWSWRKGMWEGISADQRKEDSDKGSTIIHA